MRWSRAGLPVSLPISRSSSPAGPSVMVEEAPMSMSATRKDVWERRRNTDGQVKRHSGQAGRRTSHEAPAVPSSAAYVESATTAADRSPAGRVRGSPILTCAHQADHEESGWTWGPAPKSVTQRQSRTPHPERYWIEASETLRRRRLAFRIRTAEMTIDRLRDPANRTYDVRPTPCRRQ
jgi:hypothetical protein